MSIENIDTKTSNLLFAGFSKSGDLIQKNNLFDSFFSDIKEVKDLKNKEFYDLGEYSPNTIIIKSEKNNLLYQFDIVQDSKYLFCVGDILDSDFFSANIHAKDNIESQLLSDDDLKNSQRLYCTFILDSQFIVSFYSENVSEVFDIHSPYGKRIDEILGSEFLDKVIEKIAYLDFVDDLSIEFSDKMVVVSKMEYGFLCVNVYPYSKKNCDQLEEVSALKSKIKLLKKDIRQKDNLIKIQKDIINNLSQTSNFTSKDDVEIPLKKIANILSDLQNEYSNISFIDIDFNVCDKSIEMKNNRNIEGIIKLIKEQINCKNEKIYQISDFNYAILLKYSQNDDFEIALKKYLFLLNKTIGTDMVKFKIIRTDAKH